MPLYLRELQALLAAFNKPHPKRKGWRYELAPAAFNIQIILTDGYYVDQRF